MKLVLQLVLEGTPPFTAGESAVGDAALIMAPPGLRIVLVHAARAVVWRGADGAPIAGALADVVDQVEVIYPQLTERQSGRSACYGASPILSGPDTPQPGPATGSPLRGPSTRPSPPAPSWGVASPGGLATPRLYLFASEALRTGGASNSQPYSPAVTEKRSLSLRAECLREVSLLGLRGRDQGIVRRGRARVVDY